MPGWEGLRRYCGGRNMSPGCGSGVERLRESGDDDKSSKYL